MKRNVDMNEISDGKLYGKNDLVKCDCNKCVGCSACCQGMGQSILLDPLDIYRLTLHLNSSFEMLLADKIELNVVDGVILPNLKMADTTNACAFLNAEGRCSIHSARPGICRIFPLGRFYENHSFQYFLQIHECPKPNKTKVKVKKWIDTQDLEKNERFIMQWHDFIEELQQTISQLSEDELIKRIDLFVLQHFYIEPYHREQDFYEQFQTRLEKAKAVIASITPKTGELA